MRIRVMAPQWQNLSGETNGEKVLEKYQNQTSNLQVLRICTVFFAICVAPWSLEEALID